MLIGDKTTFAIECHHDAFPNDAHGVFGRMCLWSGGHALGDPHTTACMLNVTEARLEVVLARLDSLSDASLQGLTPEAAFNVLDDALYVDDGRSDDQIEQDASRFAKFDFLTNGGESFDGTKSFLLTLGGYARLLAKDAAGHFHTTDVPQEVFFSVVRSFLAWIRDEEASELLREVLDRGLDDWIQASELAGVVLRVAGAPIDAPIRAACLSLIRRILTSGLMTAGDVTVDGFHPWSVSAEDAFSRIEADWPKTGTPGLGEVCWLRNTAAGDALARRSAPPGA